MKVNELMLGNWVMFLGKPRKVSSLGPDNKVQFFGENKVIVSDDELSPIPLTTEILGKNFEGIPGGFQFKANGRRVVCDECWLVIYRGSFTELSKCIESVHELQNALHTCGVEKEIEL